MNRWLITQPERSYNRLRLYVSYLFYEPVGTSVCSPRFNHPRRNRFAPILIYCKELLKQYRI